MFAFLIPAGWQSLASWVQLNVCDPLLEEYICWHGYPECNCLNTRVEITHWELLLCMCPRKSGEHNPKVNTQKDSLRARRGKNCALMYSKQCIFCGTDGRVFRKRLQVRLGERAEMCWGRVRLRQGGCCQLTCVRHTGSTRVKSVPKVRRVLVEQWKGSVRSKHDWVFVSWPHCGNQWWLCGREPCKPGLVGA